MGGCQSIPLWFLQCSERFARLSWVARVLDWLLGGSRWEKQQQEVPGWFGGPSSKHYLLCSVEEV